MSLERIDRRLLDSDRDAVWELYHESSKVSFVEAHPIHKRWPSDAAVVAGMRGLRRVKPYRDLPKVALPAELPASRRSFDDVVRRRTTARGFGGGAIDLVQLAKVLHFAYGISRDEQDSGFPRPFRMVPSGGALYPLELYVAAIRVAGLSPGLYHFDPEEHELDVLRQGDPGPEMRERMVQQDLARNVAATIFVTAVFTRSMFKYGDRGYRFVLLEAGHSMQNALLTAQEMGLATTSIGGYDDRRIDRWLGIDGLNESTVYALHVGTPQPRAVPAPEGESPSSDSEAPDADGSG